jgi:hypothetical protein
MKRPYSVFITLLLILAACQPTDGTLDSSRSSPTIPKDFPGEAVIVYKRSGGIAGTHGVWLIYADGRLEVSSRPEETTQMQLPSGAVEHALQRIAEAGFFDLKGNYVPLDQCCDRFTYELTVNYEGRVNTVTTMDGAEQPTALVEALAVVNDLIQEAEPDR